VVKAPNLCTGACGGADAGFGREACAALAAAAARTFERLMAHSRLPAALLAPAAQASFCLQLQSECVR